MSRTDHYAVLEDAISDVGNWRWWTADLPHTLQVEFGMVQLWSPPVEAGEKPSGLIALRFRRPLCVHFVTAREGSQELAPDWPELLHADALEPFNLSPGDVSFADDALLREMLATAGRVETIFGPGPDASAIVAAPRWFALRSGAAGLVVAAEEVVAVSHEGECSPDEVLEKNRRWWSYWKDYWARREKANALPYDPACEVTIPMRLE